MLSLQGETPCPSLYIVCITYLMCTLTGSKNNNLLFSLSVDDQKTNNKKRKYDKSIVLSVARMIESNIRTRSKINRFSSRIASFAGIYTWRQRERERFQHLRKARILLQRGFYTWGCLTIRKYKNIDHLFIYVEKNVFLGGWSNILKDLSVQRKGRGPEIRSPSLKTMTCICFMAANMKMSDRCFERNHDRICKK